MTTRLLEIASEIPTGGLDRLESPKWDSSRFQWEHYVPSSIRAAWPKLSPDARLVAYVFASEAAESDDPDRDFR
jgi:hypothetical protein